MDVGLEVELLFEALDAVLDVDALHGLRFQLPLGRLQLRLQRVVVLLQLL